MLKLVSLLVVSAVAFILSAIQPSPLSNISAQSMTEEAATDQANRRQRTVFLIMMENHNWAQIKGSPSAPYINSVLLPMASHAEQYYTPPRLHPSEPNYLWLEAGTNFGILNDL